MENQLKSWVVEQRTKGVCIAGNVLVARAKQLYDEIHPETEPADFESVCSKDRKNFRFSRGWLENFLRRRKLVMRRISSTGRDLPLDTLSRINLYFTELYENLKEYSFTLGQILNMDESCIYLDCPSNYTYSPIGVRRVKASTAGGERTRLSSSFTAAANGQKIANFFNCATCQ